MSIDILNASPYLLAILFFIIAFTYSSVGLGGGSAYTAVMVIVGMNTLAIPMLSLSLNLFVSSIGSFNFIKNKHANVRLVLPFLISSIPMAYLGGSLHVSKEIFHWLLLLSLIFVAVRIYIWRDTAFKLQLSARGRILLSLIAGSILGMIAGIVGIGGGIYLVPLIIVLGLGTEKQAAACGAIFVWLNSAAGLLSRLQHNYIDLSDYVWLIIAVVLGGALGSYLGALRFSAKLMEKILGAVILIAIVFLLEKMLFN